MPVAPKPRISFRLFVLRGFMLVVGCVGMFWGIANIARGQVSDDFWDAEGRLLRFETFSRAASIAMLESTAAQDISPCDNHAQHALMLLEIPLADAALRSGAVQDFDQRIRSLEDRARRTLSCTPRDSFVWLLMFGLENEHGNLNEHSFDLLAMSYETSPNEAWIGIRRMGIAIPVARVAPEPVQQKILDEFQNLISHGFIEAPARSYLNASAATRSLLQSRVDQLDPRSQRNFSETLQKLRS